LVVCKYQRDWRNLKLKQLCPLRAETHAMCGGKLEKDTALEEDDIYMFTLDKLKKPMKPPPPPPPPVTKP